MVLLGGDAGLRLGEIIALECGPQGVPIVSREPEPSQPAVQEMHAREPIYSVRVTLDYRAVGLLEGDEVTWLWIGSHADYDQLLKVL